jgi:hypothetical protein
MVPMLSGLFLPVFDELAESAVVTVLPACGRCMIVQGAEIG